MLKIRLKRLGAKKAPTYRVIVINSTTKREGKPIEELGYYNPKTKDMKLNIHKIQLGASTASRISDKESTNNQKIVANRKILTHFKVFVLTLSAYCPTSNITKKTIQTSSIHATVNINIFTNYFYFIL